MVNRFYIENIAARWQISISYHPAVCWLRPCLVKIFQKIFITYRLGILFVDTVKIKRNVVFARWQNRFVGDLKKTIYAISIIATGNLPIKNFNPGQVEWIRVGVLFFPLIKLINAIY